MEQKKRLVSITELTSYLYCPRKLYITKVKRIRQPLTKEMLLGRLRHNILEIFSKEESTLVKRIDQDLDKLDLVLIYENFLKNIAESIFHESKNALDSFRINKDESIKKIIKDFTEDIKLRVSNIKEKLKLGLRGEELWKNLDSIYLSEISLESELLGLKGRVDRIEINKITDKIIPYELKTREDKIYPSDELQLAAYTLLLEERYKKKIDSGIVEANAKKQEVQISQELRDKVLSIANEIRAMSENLPPPMLSNFNKCRSCSFNEICDKI